MNDEAKLMLSTTCDFFVDAIPAQIRDQFLHSKEDDPNSRMYSFYLSGEILPPEHYVNWFHAIRYATETDVVIIHINSQGGDVATATQFRRVINETDAKVIASVEGDCMSGATMIFLAADEHQISEHSCFMFHNYSSISFGKGSEMYDNIVYARKWSEHMLRSIYETFLTEDEIVSILSGKDIWMHWDEVALRLQSNLDKIIDHMEYMDTGENKSESFLTDVMHSFTKYIHPKS